MNEGGTLNILCYGASAERQKERCEFFQGAGCNAEWATDLERALVLLSIHRFDAVVFGRNISVADCNAIAGAMHSVQTGLVFFSLREMESEAHVENTDIKPGDPCASLAFVYGRMTTRGASSSA
jgi:hypothetical protein